VIGACRAVVSTAVRVALKGWRLTKALCRTAFQKDRYELGRSTETPYSF
jgi:hypothetical protein